ncbi:MAG: hypothetical protein JRI76_11980 [Deltaproteobacteria bacterium]|nr:hypothetical protein [Deltaproteobacteria bacterium]MBW1956173.1 hypothetical protein [Deltaproteobacteria bacterium]MBW2042731.1 hypothetical protein [Deltaproteobacteria bacterium]MBW2132163.1 hypothetical protein [Deltaproteobacteria bacterium]
MKLIERLERIFLPSRAADEVQVDLKEIFCKRKDEGYVKRLRTPAIGCAYRNLDGSDRQKALAKLKVGERVRLIWGSSQEKKDPVVYLVKKGGGRQLNMADCFGRLSDKVAADVIRMMTRDNIVTSARVVRITGGTRKNPKKGCILELSMYPGPKKGGSTA